MFVPTATAAGSTFWELELRAHAVANCMWVAGVNRVGVDVGGGPTDFYGRAFFTDPGGEIVGQLGSELDAILHCEVDTEVSATHARRVGVLPRPETGHLLGARRPIARSPTEKEEDVDPDHRRPDHHRRRRLRR